MQTFDTALQQGYDASDFHTIQGLSILLLEESSYSFHVV